MIFRDCCRNNFWQKQSALVCVRTGRCNGRVSKSVFQSATSSKILSELRVDSLYRRMPIQVIIFFSWLPQLERAFCQPVLIFCCLGHRKASVYFFNQNDDVVTNVCKSR